jgi:phosphohistidine swiveling domain-containing protein
MTDLLAHRDGISVRLSMLTSQPARVLQERTHLYRRLRLTKEERDLVAVLQHAAFLKDVFREQVATIVNMMMPVLREIGRRRRMGVTTLKTMSKEEVRECLFRHRTVSRRLRDQRRRRYVMIPDGGVIRTWYVTRADRLAKRIIPLERDDRQREFQGRTASAGHAKGRARIVRGVADLPSFRKGEVLVVNNTTPDFVPVMRKASAIVAEEGGITAHVAVVSREMKIPCVVGIPRITYVLNTGDLIEVNADTGVVRKL